MVKINFSRTLKSNQRPTQPEKCFFKEYMPSATSSMFNKPSPKAQLKEPETHGQPTSFPHCFPLSPRPLSRDADSIACHPGDIPEEAPGFGLCSSTSPSSSLHQNCAVPSIKTPRWLLNISPNLHTRLYKLSPN